MIRLEEYGAGIALEPYSIPARVKHLTTNCELYSICRQAQKGFFVRRTLESFVERRAPRGRDHRGSEQPPKAGFAVCIDPDRGPIVDPGTMTCVTQDGYALLLPDDLFSDEPSANDTCKFRGLLGTDPGIDNNLRVIAQNSASMQRRSQGGDLEYVSGHDGWDNSGILANPNSGSDPKLPLGRAGRSGQGSSLRGFLGAKSDLRFHSRAAWAA